MDAWLVAVYVILQRQIVAGCDPLRLRNSAPCQFSVPGVLVRSSNG
jgi:hypothetical protein